MRNPLILILFLVLGGLAHADDMWSTAVAERQSDGWKIIHRFIDKLDDPSQKLTFPMAVTFTWKYDGPNGLPAKAQTDVIYKLEDLLNAAVENRGEGKLVLVSTGNNLRSWTYYVKSESVFRKALAEAASTAQLQLQVSSATDPQWKQLDAFKKGVRP